MVDRSIVDVIGGTPGAWQQLFGTWAPVVERIARASHSMGSFAKSDDDRRDVMARVFGRLRRDNYRALRLYVTWQQRNDDRSFEDWLTVVTTNVIRDFVSAKLGEDGRKTLLCFAEALPEDSPNLLVFAHITTRETARQVLEYARETLEPEQLRCLDAWLEGCDFTEIANRCGLHDARVAEKTVRAALQRLRRSVR